MLCLGEGESEFAEEPMVLGSLIIGEIEGEVNAEYQEPYEMKAKGRHILQSTGSSSLEQA